MFFDFTVESEYGLKSVRVELQTRHVGQPAKVDVLYEETLVCCPATNPGCKQMPKRFRFQNLDRSEPDSFRESTQPSVLGDRTLFYQGIPRGTVRITLTDHHDRVTLKDLPVVFLQNTPLQNWLKNITGPNGSRGTFSPSLLEQEGFFVNFDNSHRADGDFIWWKSPFTSWSFIKTYFQTYFNSNGKKISWKNSDKSEIVKKVAICAAMVGLAAMTDGIGTTLLAHYECELANYVLWAPIYAKVMNRMSAWCTGFSTAFQMWRNGKIKWSDFSSCNYYQSGSYPPAACDDTMRGSCYFECCRRRDEDNKCTDSITENDLMLYLAGMQGKTMTGEFLTKYKDFARFKDDHLMGFPSLFFPGICHLPSGIKDSTAESFAFYNHFFQRWSPGERETWLVENCQDNPQRIIRGSEVLTMSASTTNPNAHSIVPIRMQHTGDTDRLYVYDPNRAYLSYGLRCLRPFDPADPWDTVDFTLSSWRSECGGFGTASTKFEIDNKNIPNYLLNWQDNLPTPKYSPPQDLNGNYFRHVYNYLDLDIRRQRFIYDEYKKFALVTSPHAYSDNPASVPNLILELGDELGEWMEELFDKKKIHSISNGPEVPTRLPLPGLSDDIRVLAYLHTEPPQIRRTMDFPAGKSSFYYVQYGKHLGVSVEVEPTRAASVTTTARKEDRSIHIQADSTVDSLQLKSMTFFPHTLQTIEGKRVFDENGNVVVQDYQYMVDAQIVSEGVADWNLTIFWDEEKNIILENAGNQALTIHADLHTSYLPYLPEVKDMTELEPVVALFVKHKLPLERNLNFVVPGNKKLKIAVGNWRQLSSTEVRVEDISMSVKPKSTGCSTSKIGGMNSSWIFILVFIAIFTKKRKMFVVKRSFILVLSFFLLIIPSCDDDITHQTTSYGINVNLVENPTDNLAIYLKDTSYENCFGRLGGTIGLVPAKILVFSEGNEMTIDVNQYNIDTIAVQKFTLNNFSFYLRYSHSPKKYPYKTAYSIFEGKSSGWFDSQFTKEHWENASTINNSTTYLEIESEVQEISLGVEWESPVFGRFEKPEAVYVLDKK